MDSETTPSSGMIGLLAWVEVNKKKLLIGGIAAVALIAIAVIIIQQRTQRQVSASKALSDVRLPFNPGAPLPAGVGDALVKVAGEYQGTKAAARALLVSAAVLFEEGRYADAQSRFNQVLQQYPESSWTAEANLGVAASLAAQSKTADAITKYEEIRRRFATSPIIDETKLALVRLYSASKPEDAFKLADEIQKAGGQGSGLAMEAAMIQEELLKKNPELAKLREPLVAPPTPAPQTVTLTNLPTRVAAATNRPTMVITAMPNRMVTNVPTVPATNPPAAQPIPIKLSPAPASAAPPAPAPAPPK